MSIVRNEKDISEWLDHHRKIGVEHFYLAEHRNEFPIPVADDITLLPVDQSEMLDQIKFYATELSKAESRWCACIDADEFIIVKNDLHDFLTNYEEYGALGIHWLCFGTSGYEKRQPSVLNNYVWRCPYEFGWNRHIKSIIKTTNQLNDFSNIHNLSHNTVDEKFQKIDGALAKYTGDLIRLNHYWTKSKEDFSEKIAKCGFYDKRYDDYIRLYNNLEINCTVNDPYPLEIRTDRLE